jgi:alkanesulfonate monooxygenase SsuD/methylene tetrahydromethanopterin reductase-like flavin-dependent oxidoreductase (luciferase family)
VAASVPVIVNEDVEVCADLIRPTLALYIGGMGARQANFHRDVFARMGYEEVAHKVQEHYLAGQKAEAAATIPTELIEEVALIGPPAKIRDELDRWRETCVTTLLVRGDRAWLPQIADVVLG